MDGSAKSSARAGPTVAFNVRNESPAAVGALAAAAGIQMRHGCFCNPGACAAALGLTPADVRDAGDRGQACGGADDVDARGRPLGALRASLGKDSTFEDVDGPSGNLSSDFPRGALPATRPRRRGRARGLCGTPTAAPRPAPDDAGARVALWQPAAVPRPASDDRARA